jgi:hypothetical protein
MDLTAGLTFGKSLRLAGMVKLAVNHHSKTHLGQATTLLHNFEDHSAGVLHCNRALRENLCSLAIATFERFGGFRRQNPENSKFIALLQQLR